MTTPGGRGRKSFVSVVPFHRAPIDSNFKPRDRPLEHNILAAKTNLGLSVSGESCLLRSDGRGATCSGTTQHLYTSANQSVLYGTYIQVEDNRRRYAPVPTEQASLCPAARSQGVRATLESIRRADESSRTRTSLPLDLEIGDTLRHSTQKQKKQ